MNYSLKKILMPFLLLLTLIVSAVGVIPAQAATLVVMNTNDSGAGSLRQAIADAIPNDTITFDSSLSGQTIRLASTLTINKNLTIDGSSLASQIIISGDTDANTTGDVRVFIVNPGATVTMDSLTITKGMGNVIVPLPDSLAEGGGIFNAGNLTLRDSTLTFNTASRPGTLNEAGGALANHGTATVVNTTFLSNHSTWIGGAIYNYTGADMTVVNSTLFGNFATDAGGGILNRGTLDLLNSTLSDNLAGNDTNNGGGLYNWDEGTLNYANTIIANSVDGGDCFNFNGAVTSTNNLVEDGSATCSPTLTGDPKLVALANNGGPNQTMALQADSPALGEGDPAVCSTALINNLDQRGEARPQGRGNCDIGAFESSFDGDRPASPIVTAPIGLTDDSTPTISGTAEANSFVDVWYRDDLNNFIPICEDVIVDGLGDWSCDSLITLPERTIQLKVNTTDGLGKTSADTTHFFTIDFTPPAAPVVNTPAAITNDATPTISGTAEANSLVNVWYYDDSDALVLICQDVLVNGSGNWTCNSSVTLPAREIELKVNATDALDRTSPDASHTFVVDVTAPAVVSIQRVSAQSTNAASVNFTVTFSEAVSGVAANDFALHSTGSLTGASIQSINGSGITRTVIVNTGSGNGTLRLDIPASATITDQAGSALGSLPFTGGQSYNIFKTATYIDVPTNYWSWMFVERLSKAGITSGCGNGNYCPDGTVTRAQMAIFLLRGIHGNSYSPPAVGSSTGFGDVPTDHWAAKWIKQLAAEGITSGCGNGNYCPDSSVTRAQMSIFLLRSKHGLSYSPPAVGSSTGFGDVQPDYWAAKWIKQLVAESITAGCGSGNYCPESPVTRAQMAIFLVRTFNLP